ncbi:EF-hand domain-containing family member B [Neosynchiropus ocellatus]
MADEYSLPTLPRAGKLKPAGDRTKDCLQDISAPPTPPEVKEFNHNHQPGVQARHPGKASDPDVAGSLVHGIRTRSSDSTCTILSLPRRTVFQEKLQELRESGYASRRKAPLGRSHDQSAGLPPWYNSNITFGIKSAKDVTVGDVICSSKPSEPPERETGGGERPDGQFQVSRDGRFGIITPHSNDGRDLRRTLRWHDEPLRFHNPKPDWSRSSGSREKMMRLYNVKNTKGNGASVPAHWTFGVRGRSDECGVGDLLAHSQPRGRLPARVVALQHQLKKLNHQRFSSLLQAFRHYDKKGEGAIAKERLQEVCREFQVDVSDPVLDELMSLCDSDQDGVINFLEFANFLNWKDKMPLSQREQRILTSERRTCSAPGSTERKTPSASEALIQPEDLEPVASGSSLKTVRTLRRLRAAPEHFTTSSSIFGSGNGESPEQPDSRTFGVPTVRSDLPAPRIKRVSDSTNYGDTSTAANLLHPPLHSLQGVHERHFFSPLTKAEVTEIFRNVGVSVSEETFEEAWKLAAMRDAAGEVCVEAFRTALKEIGAM